MSRTTEPVIDLGVYSFDPDADAELVADRAGWGPGWQRLRRRWLTGLLVPLLLATVDSAPSRPALVPLWDAGGFLVASGDTAYGLEQAAGAATLTAYRLEDGAVQWQRRLPGDAWSQPSLSGGVLLSVGPAPGIGSVVAIDAATGQVLWSVEQEYPLGVGDQWVFAIGLEAFAGAGTEGLPGGGEAPYEATVRDLRTGETAWTRRFAPGEVPLFGVTEHLFTFQPSGRLTQYDPATGSVLAVAQTAPLPAVEEDGSGQRMLAMPDGTVVPLGLAPVATVVDDLVIVTDWSGTVAYEALTLRQRWRADQADWVAACGSLVCDYRSATGTVRAVDPVTGAMRWSRDCDQDLEIDQSQETTCFLTQSFPQPEPVLQRVTFGVGGQPTYSLISLDETTGAMHAVLTGWSATGVRDGDRALVSSDNFTAVGGADPRVWLAWWRAEPGALEVLGSVDAEWCSHLTGPYLYCGVWGATGQAERVGVWRVG